MAAFKSLDWRRLDTFALLIGHGLASVEPESVGPAHAWLSRNGYAVIHLDFARGISAVVEQLGQTLAWEHQFGYRHDPESRNLAALRDGFRFDIPSESGLVLDLVSFEEAFRENESWSLGFLAIVSDHSLRALAQGLRFFALVHLASDESPMLERHFEALSVPYPYPFRDVSA